MNVAWGLCWGGSRGTRPVFFPCKVAAACDEKYLVNFFLEFLLKKRLNVQNLFFSLAPRSGFGAAISHAVARSFMFRPSISRYRIVMAASRWSPRDLETITADLETMIWKL